MTIVIPCVSLLELILPVRMSRMKGIVQVQTFVGRKRIEQAVFRCYQQSYGRNRTYDERRNFVDVIIVDATILNAPSSTKNASKARDPEMHQTKKGNEWRFGMKCHIGVGAGSELVHSAEVTAANEHDITQAAKLLREDDEVVYVFQNTWAYRKDQK